MKELQEVVERYRSKGCDISETDVKRAYRIAKRKIEICGKDNDYMLLMFENEIRNAIFRKSINAITEIRRLQYV